LKNKFNQIKNALFIANKHFEYAKNEDEIEYFITQINNLNKKYTIIYTRIRNKYQ